MSQPPQNTLVGVLFALMVVLLPSNLGGAEIPFVPFKAPDLAVKEWLTPNGPQQADLIGRPYVVEFWATWCSSCKQSVKHMTDLQNRYAAKGLIIITFAQDKSADTVRSFISQKHINYHAAMETGLSTNYSVKQIPVVFVVDHHGQVVWRGFPWDEAFETMVEKVVDESPPPVTSGVHLGPYESYKAQLQGGAGFAAAYRDILAQSQLADNPNAATARSIILAIDVTIGRKINRARSLRYSDSASAYRIFAELVRKYDGIAATKPAADAILAMKAAHEIKPELYAASVE